MQVPVCLLNVIYGNTPHQGEGIYAYNYQRETKNNTSTVNQSSERRTHPPDSSTLVKQPQGTTDLPSGTQSRQENDNSTIPYESEQSDEDVAYRTALYHQVHGQRVNRNY